MLSTLIPSPPDQTPPNDIAEHLLSTLADAADRLNGEPELRRQMTGRLGPIDAEVAIRTEDGSASATICISDGRFEVSGGDPQAEVDASLWFRTAEELADYTQASPDEAMMMMLAGRARLEGNPAAFGYVSYLLSLLTLDRDLQAIQEQTARHHRQNEQLAGSAGPPQPTMRRDRLDARLTAESIDPGVRWLADPYLPDYRLSDFPRLERFKRDHLETVPEVTAEFGELLTDFHVAHGFETMADGTPWDPMLRSAKAFEHLMRNRLPVVREGDLLGGTITPNPVCGSVTQPYTVGWSIWGEMATLSRRELDPFTISDADRETLHGYVFPYWMDKHVQQVWKQEFDYPLAAKISDRMYCFNFWGLVSLNPGSPGFARVVDEGLITIRRELELKLSSAGDDVAAEQLNAWEAMATSIEGVLAYAERVAQLAERSATEEEDPARRRELEEMGEILGRVPLEGARTLAEAVQSLWIMFIAVGLDSMDDDITIGRLDQILQPYFDSDLRSTPPEGRQEYIERAIELVGCLFLRFTSHRIAAATIASWQNSGAPGVASVTVGGVTSEGEDAVNDMTYIVLKVAELLSLDDPDMDARYMPGVNSTAYIRRVAELNYLTSGTPSIHNDATIIPSMCQHGWDERDARDWVSCGCVEPVIHGKHFGATGDLDSNLLVPLTMAIYNGIHPTARWTIGPRTGEVDDFADFEEFMTAFRTQFEFLYDQGFEASRQILSVHQQLMPAPLYSALLEGCIRTGRGMTHGGATYNSSGASLIGLSDVIDSLLVIEELVFGSGEVGFGELRQAMDDDFEGHEVLRARILNDVPKFGSGDPRGRAMAQRVTEMIADNLHAHDNGRGGHYATGYRTNNNHTVYGRVSGASPSGRLAGTPFTSGLTPCAGASDNILDNLNDVASIDPMTCDNNYTLNVRVTFSDRDAHRQNVDRIADYVQAYFLNGGMQVQFNMVDSDTLKDAMARPHLYPDLIARVSGYTGYFVRMQRDLQLEIIGRAEFVV